jgi:hypothetical protein
VWDLLIEQSKITAQPWWESFDAVHDATTSPPGNDGCDENFSKAEARAELAHGCRQALAGVLIVHDQMRPEFWTALLSS